MNIHVHHHHHDTHRILTRLEDIMATVAELSTKVDELQTALDTEQQQIADAFAAFLAEVADLKAQLLAGGTEAERQAVSDKLDAAIADLQATIPDAPTPPEEPVV
jgi:chromosome condensin MukBEF complex kleisin-like MukF subunit